MKKQIFTFVLVLVSAAVSQASVVCMFKSASSGITSTLHLHCSNNGRVAVYRVAESESVRGDRTAIINAKVEKIRDLIDNGFELKTEDILVKK